MKFERLTDPGPKGGKAAFAKGKTPEQSYPSDERI
jgi:hypothetical protein